MKNLKMQLALLLLSALCLLTGAYGQVTLANHVNEKVANGSAIVMSPYTPTQKLRLALALQPPHMAEEEEFLAELETKGSPNFHKFLTPEEWNARFAPSAEDEQKVVDWATSQGLTVTSRFANRLLVENLRASAEEVRARYLDRQSEFPADWQRASGETFSVAHVTPDELSELRAKVLAVMAPYIRLDPAERSPGCSTSASICRRVKFASKPKPG